MMADQMNYEVKDFIKTQRRLNKNCENTLQIQPYFVFSRKSGDYLKAELIEWGSNIYK